MKYLILIVGPTAIGKTSLSIALAQHFKCEIVSCDSRQFFKEMSIGTAIPSKKEQAAVQHHFIQNKSIFENYTVGDFEREAIESIKELHQNNSFAIMVGGSGLYVDAVLKGMDAFPEIESEVRALVKLDFKTKGLPFLQEKLKALDLFYYEKIKAENPQTLQNPQRMTRFVEVCVGTGKPYSSFLNQNIKKRDFTSIIIGLEADRAEMYDRINRRVDIMLNEGLVQEAKELYTNKNLNALQTVGYRELFDFFDNNISLEFAIEEIKKNTRRFSKRQMTWFKRTENVAWFDFKTSAKTIAEFIENKL